MVIVLVDEDKLVHNILGCEYLIIHRDAVCVDELIKLGHRLGVID